MATCFWQRCTCPTFMPCQEHQGIWCGRFRGRVIADLAEIRNDLVDAAFAVIRSLESRAGDADASAVAAEALQRDWERRRAELEQRYPDPGSGGPPDAARRDRHALARGRRPGGRPEARDRRGLRAHARPRAGDRVPRALPADPVPRRGRALRLLRPEGLEAGGRRRAPGSGAAGARSGHPRPGPPGPRGVEHGHRVPHRGERIHGTHRARAAGRDAAPRVPAAPRGPDRPHRPRRCASIACARRSSGRKPSSSRRASSTTGSSTSPPAGAPSTDGRTSSRHPRKTARRSSGRSTGTSRSKRGRSAAAAGGRR